MTEDEIRELFRKHTVPLSRKDVWTVQGNPVIRHAALERLAAHLCITFDPPTFIRSETSEAVILVTGRRGGITEWSLGESLIDTNYRVSGKQAAYVYAMAEKRGKDRVILKLAQLYGAYSEDESDDFKQPEMPREAIKAPPAPPEPEPVSGGAGGTVISNVRPAEPAKRAPPRKELLEEQPGGRPREKVKADIESRNAQAAESHAETELFEYADPASGEIRHVTEAELESLTTVAAQHEQQRVEALRQAARQKATVHPAPPPKPLGIPAFLRRSPAAPTAPPNGPVAPVAPGWPDGLQDPDAFLKRLDTELGKLPTGDAMQELWEKRVDPIYSDLFPPDGEEAQSILRHHMRAVEP